MEGFFESPRMIFYALRDFQCMCRSCKPCGTLTQTTECRAGGLHRAQHRLYHCCRGPRLSLTSPSLSYLGCKTVRIRHYVFHMCPERNTTSRVHLTVDIDDTHLPCSPSAAGRRKQLPPRLEDRLPPVCATEKHLKAFQIQSTIYGPHLLSYMPLVIF